MNNRLITALIVLAVVGSASLSADEPPPQTADTDSADAGSLNESDFKPRTLIRPIRAIVDAAFLKASEVEDEVSDNELVIGVVVDDVPRAYPINMLTGPSREIINDRLGDTLIAATW